MTDETGELERWERRNRPFAIAGAALVVVSAAWAIWHAATQPPWHLLGSMPWPYGVRGYVFLSLAILLAMGGLIGAAMLLARRARGRMLVVLFLLASLPYAGRGYDRWCMTSPLHALVVVIVGDPEATADPLFLLSLDDMPIWLWDEWSDYAPKRPLLFGIDLVPLLLLFALRKPPRRLRAHRERAGARTLREIHAQQQRDAG